MIAFVGVIVVALALLTETLFALRRRWLRKGLSKILFDERLPKKLEDVTEDSLREYCRNDAIHIIESCFGGLGTSDDRFRRIFGVGFGPIHRRDIERAAEETCPDLKPLAARIANRLGGLAPQLTSRLRRSSRAFVLFWASVASAIYFWRPVVLWPQGANESGLAQLPLLQLLMPSTATPGVFSTVVSIVVTSLIVAIVASLLVTQVIGDEDLVGGAELDEGRTQARQRKPMIGRDGCAVRVVNFAGGGFDSIMQLGVVHALMVIQGRPPDAVVGMSTGAIPAAALAEVLQAGESKEADFADRTWKKLDASEQLELQSHRMQARVRRFQQFERAAYEARERLYDVLTPDAYQVHSSDPLAPLETPFFQKPERDEKVESLSTKSGLIRLYNDVLEVNVPFDAIVRVIRRVLGLLASAEIQRWYMRWSLRVLEFNRIWLLVGSNLLAVARLVPMFVRPLVGTRRTRPQSAGSLIFRFPINDKVGAITIRSAAFLLLLVIWLGGSLLPFILVTFSPLPLKEELWLIVVLAIAYAAVAMFGLIATYRFDTISLADAFRDATRGAAQFTWLLVKLSVVLIGIVAAVKTIWDTVDFTLIDNSDIRYVPKQWFSDHLESILWLIFEAVRVGTVLFIIGAGIVGLAYLSTRGWAKYKKLRLPFSFGGSYLQKLLRYYNLDRSLLHTYDLRSFLVELFDSGYFGETDLNEVVSDSLRDAKERSSNPAPSKKRVADYGGDHHVSPIHVGIAAANVLDGDLETIPECEPVVDSIEAAMALVPLYPAKQLGGRLFVNGTNIARVPTRATSSFLRNRVNPKSGAVLLYSVSPFPISRPGLSDQEHSEGPYLQLWDVVKRAIRLQRHRDAKLEQALTDFYTRVIPRKNKEGELTNRISVDRPDGRKDFLRMWVTPIESTEPLNANNRILDASKDEQRRVVAEIIADGCRAALEIMIRPSIEKRAPGGTVSCIRAVRRNWRSQKRAANLKMSIDSLLLPGSNSKVGPGLISICEHCALNRKSRNTREKTRGRLRLNEDVEVAHSAWPHERAGKDRSLKDHPSIARKIETESDNLRKRYKAVGPWPVSRRLGDSTETDQRPTVSLLFSGGVFRGVYQMGVLNALNEIRLRPDLIAGASIGTITAAMVARVFSMETEEPADDCRLPRPTRHRQIAQLSAVYLAVDRLILTDRFADFVRNLTIRASRIRFSMREADHFFRKYDYPRSGEFNRLARKVLAGLERLFYINPYQLNKLVMSIRNEKDHTLVPQIREYVEQWLQRMNIGVEMLGAEPLQELIEQYVIPDKYQHDKQCAPFSAFLDNDLQFLATATNLKDGTLQVIGEPPPAGRDEEIEECLIESLLASSAFPGVFRPRWSKDLRPGSVEEAQLIDGGVLDNLPIEPVFDFLNGVAAADGLCGRPVHNGLPAPHLVFAASLEVDTPKLVYRDEWKRFECYWPTLLSRTSELKYNIKSDIYRKAQQNLRAIHDAVYEGKGGDPGSVHAYFEPFDVEVVTVKPKWLCGTFSFHPMLGFRREQQARSIAHGCASTLLRIASVDRQFRSGWNVDSKWLPQCTTFDDAFHRWQTEKKKSSTNACWIRPNIPCPYSAGRLWELNDYLRKNGDTRVLDKVTINELSKIHKFCSERKSHRPD